MPEQAAENADPRLALVTAAIHLTRHAQHPHHCRCGEFASAALTALSGAQIPAYLVHNVARSLYGRWCDNYGFPERWDDISEHSREAYRADALAALRVVADLGMLKEGTR